MRHLAVMLLAATLAGCATAPVAPVPKVARVHDAGAVVRTKIVEVQADTAGIKASVKQTQDALADSQAIVSSLEKKIAEELKPELSTLRARLSDAEVSVRMAQDKLVEVTARLGEALKARAEQEQAEMALQVEIDTLGRDRDAKADLAAKEAVRANTEAKAATKWRWHTFEVTLLLILACAWIFKRPLLRLMGVPIP